MGETGQRTDQRSAAPETMLIEMAGGTGNNGGDGSRESN